MEQLIIPMNLNLQCFVWKMYKAFTDKSNILKDYIIPEYEILHTQSKEYIVDDIIELMQERGVIG